MNRMRDSAMADVVGTALMVAVVTAAIGTFALVVLSNPGPADPLTTNLEVLTNTTSIRVRHTGGEPLNTAEAGVWVLADGSQERYPFTQFTNKTVFRAGDTVCLTCGGLFDGQEVTEVRLASGVSTKLEWFGSVVASSVPLPDIQVSLAATTPSAPVEGQVTTFTARVANEGTGNWSGLTTSVSFYLDGSGTPFSTKQITTGIAPFGGATTLTSAGIALTEGTHTVRIVADSFSNVTELRETNNEVNATVSVLPDLVGQYLSSSPSQPDPGQSTTFSIRVWNNGTANITSSTFSVTFAVDGTVFSTKEISNLNWGASTDITSDAWIATAGFQNLTVSIDAYGNITESNELNNGLQQELTILADLTTHVESMSPDPPGLDDPTTFTARVWNNGTTAVTASETVSVQFFLDGSSTPFSTKQITTGLAAGSSTTVTSDAWTATAGSHNLTARVDPFNNVTESDDANNNSTLLTFTVSNTPDLKTHVASMSDPTPNSGQSITFTGRVYNNGTANLANLDTVAFYIDGELLSYESIGQSLNTGQSRDVTSDAWTATVGEHTVRVEADPFNNVTETNEGDNNATHTFTVAGPDLTAHVESRSVSDPSVDDPMTFTARIYNNGTNDWTSGETVSVMFFVNGTAAAFSSHEITGPISAGSSTTVTSSAWDPVGAASYTIVAQVDTQNNLTEENETNNNGTMAVSVGRTDLTAHVETVNPTTPSVGQSTTFTARIWNNGTADLRSSITVSVGFYLDGSSTPFSIKEITTGLGDGSSTTVTSGAWTASGAGGHTIKATVDVFGNSTESNEGNNDGTRSFTVSGASAPDLTVNVETITPSAPSEGQSTTFTARIWNNGTATTGAGTIQVNFYIDGGGSPFSTKTFSGPLSAGSSTTVTSGAWTAGAGGSHTIRAYVDATNVINNESSETNNNKTRTFSVTGRPDLRVEYVSTNPSAPDNSCNPTMTVRVYNDGSVASGAFTLNFNVAGSGGGDYPKAVSSIPANSNVLVTSDALAHHSQNQDHTHDVTITADSGGVVTESNESNNTALRTMQVFKNGTNC